jgi:hypothetical protein
MLSFIDSRHCQIGDDLKCKACHREMEGPHHLRLCKTRDRSQDKTPIKKKRRERTEVEIEAVGAICAVCRYFKHGMCMLLVRKGCGSCKTADDFAKKIKRGIECADKPPRFAGTEFVEAGASK